MNISEKKIACEALYKEYLELQSKTRDGIKNYTPGQNINPDDLLRKEEIRQRLIACKDCLELKPEEWFEIDNG